MAWSHVGLVGKPHAACKYLMTLSVLGRSWTLAAISFIMRWLSASGNNTVSVLMLSTCAFSGTRHSPDASSLHPVSTGCASALIVTSSASYTFTSSGSKTVTYPASATLLPLTSVCLMDGIASAVLAGALNPLFMINFSPARSVLPLGMPTTLPDGSPVP